LDELKTRRPFADVNVDDRPAIYFHTHPPADWLLRGRKRPRLAAPDRLEHHSNSTKSPARCPPSIHDPKPP